MDALDSDTPREHEVDEVVAVREEAWPAIGASRLQLQERSRRTAPLGHAHQRTAGVDRGDDDAAGAPGSAARLRRLAKRGGGASGHFDPLQLRLGEEADRPAVGGPERERRTLGPGKHARFERIERPQIEKVVAVGAGRDEREHPPVGRNGQHPLNGRARGRRDREAEPGQGRAGGELRRGTRSEPRSEREEDARRDPAQGGASPSRRGRRARSRPGRTAASVELERDVAGVLHAALGVLREAAAHEAVERRRRSSAGARRRDGGSLFRMAEISVAWLVPANGLLPGRHLVEHARRARRCPSGRRRASPRSCSGAMYCTVPRIVPGSVVRRPVGSARHHRRSGARREGLGEAEVEELHPPVGRQHHVLGLQVPVDDPLRVRRGQRVGDLLCRSRRTSATGEDPRRCAPRSVSPSSSSMTRRCAAGAISSKE